MKPVTNGLQKFEKWGDRAFQLADEKDRTFNVEIFPKEYLAHFDRSQVDYGQVLVYVKVKP